MKDNSLNNSKKKQITNERFLDLINEMNSSRELSRGSRNDNDNDSEPEYTAEQLGKMEESIRQFSGSDFNMQQSVELSNSLNSSANDLVDYERDSSQYYDINNDNSHIIFGAAVLFLSCLIYFELVYFESDPMIFLGGTAILSFGAYALHNINKVIPPDYDCDERTYPILYGRAAKLN